MPQDYHDSAPTQTEVYWRPVPAPLAYRPNPIEVSRPGSIAKAAVAGAVAFLATGLAGGVWLGLQLASARVTAAENRANDAQQRQQQAEDRLSAQLDQTAKFCQAALSGQPQAPSPEAIAQTPKP